MNWITMTRKSAWTTTHDIQEHWTVVSTLLSLISRVYRNLHHCRSNQRPHIAVPKLYNWAISSYRTQVTPNQLVLVIARPYNLNVSCKLHPYSFQRTRSPPEPRLPKKLRNTHLTLNRTKINIAVMSHTHTHTHTHTQTPTQHGHKPTEIYICGVNAFHTH